MTSREQWHTYSLIMSIESWSLLLSSLNRCFHSSNVGDLSNPERFSSPPAHMLVASIFFHQVTTSRQLIRSWTQIHSIRNWLFGLLYLYNFMFSDFFLCSSFRRYGKIYQTLMLILYEWFSFNKRNSPLQPSQNIYPLSWITPKSP